MGRVVFGKVPADVKRLLMFTSETMMSIQNKLATRMTLLRGSANRADKFASGLWTERSGTDRHKGAEADHKDMIGCLDPPGGRTRRRA